MKHCPKRLFGWKSKFLTLGGRTILAKATLNNIPLREITFIKLPKEITKKIDRIQRNFAWGSNQERKKLHLLNGKPLPLAREMGVYGSNRVAIKTLPCSQSWRGNFLRKRDLSGHLYYIINMVGKGIMTRRMTPLNKTAIQVVLGETSYWDGKHARSAPNGI